MENICNFCDKIFTNKYNLLAHQKTTKSCLEKQGLKNKEYKCEHCSKIFITNKRFVSHIEKCNLKDKNELSKYKELFNQKEKEYNDLFNKKEKEYREYKELLSKKDQEIMMIKENIKDLKNQLKDANNTIAEIAKLNFN